MLLKLTSSCGWVCQFWHQHLIFQFISGSTFYPRAQCIRGTVESREMCILLSLLTISQSIVSKLCLLFSCHIITSEYVHSVSKKLCKIVLSERRQISNNFDNFWQKDGKEAKIMRGALTFHLTYFA